MLYCLSNILYTFKNIVLASCSCSRSILIVFPTELKTIDFIELIQSFCKFTYIVHLHNGIFIFSVLLNTRVR